MNPSFIYVIYCRLANSDAWFPQESTEDLELAKAWLIKNRISEYNKNERVYILVKKITNFEVLVGENESIY